MNRSFFLHLCNQRISNIWTRPHVACRRGSTLIKSDFTSFFFHNEQWTATPSRQKKLDRPSFRRITHAVPVMHEDEFRETEALTPRRLLKIYMQLSKTNLTVLNVLAAMSCVALCPLPTTVPVLLSTAVGTALCASSANTLNQLQEVPYDSQMTRTRMRPLVRRAISPLHATGFAVVTGICGPAILWTMVNPMTAILGAANIALYAGLYTWLKRKHVVNTWVGAVVGAVPPLMGWTACGGHIFPSSNHPFEFFLPQFLSSMPAVPIDLSLIDNPLSPFAFCMFLFSWQFPHFNAISYLVRGSYAQAGFQMLSVLSPSHNALVALRHAILLIPICSILFPLSGLTTWTFALTSLVPNAICTQAAWNFWRGGAEKEARIVFQHSLWYLPVVMALMMVHKQGMDWVKWVRLTSEDEIEEP